MTNDIKSTLETNDSIMHSITLCSKQDYEDWVAKTKYYTGEYNEELPKFATLEAINAYMCKETTSWHGFEADNAESLLADYEIYSYEYYYSTCCESYGTFKQLYRTAAGEEIIAFGYYEQD